MRPRYLAVCVSLLLVGFAMAAGASVANPSPRIAQPIGEVKLPDGSVYQLMSALDEQVPDVKESAKILGALAAGDPLWSVFARAFPRVPIQIVPLEQNDRYREYLIGASVGVGSYEVTLRARASLNVDLSECPMGRPPVFGAYFVPPEVAKDPGRAKLNDIGPSTPPKFEDMEEFARGPEAYLRAHVPSNTRGQHAMIWGFNASFHGQVDLSFDKLKGELGELPFEEHVIWPAYPRWMRYAGMSGDVTFEVTVLAAGSVADFAVIKASQPEFVPCVEEAVKAWKFRPEPTAFGARAAFMVQFSRRIEVRPLRLRGTVRFKINAELMGAASGAGSRECEPSQETGSGKSGQGLTLRDSGEAGVRKLRAEYAGAC